MITQADKTLISPDHIAPSLLENKAENSEIIKIEPTYTQQDVNIVAIFSDYLILIALNTSVTCCFTEQII